VEADATFFPLKPEGVFVPFGHVALKVSDFLLVPEPCESKDPPELCRVAKVRHDGVEVVRDVGKRGWSAPIPAGACLGASMEIR